MIDSNLARPGAVGKPIRRKEEVTSSRPARVVTSCRWKSRTVTS